MGMFLRFGENKELAMREEAPKTRPLFKRRVEVAWPSNSAPTVVSIGVNILDCRGGDSCLNDSEGVEPDV